MSNAVSMQLWLFFCDTLVINELDGLSKGCRDRQSEFSDMLRSGARIALNYLEQEFEARNNHLKSMTSEGTMLDTIAFRSEQFKDLVCLFHYCIGGFHQVVSYNCQWFTSSFIINLFILRCIIQLYHGFHQIVSMIYIKLY